MSTGSRTYASWVSWLDAFGRGEDPPLDHLGPIGAAMGPYVEARLVDRVAVAFAARVRHWQGTLGARIVALPPSEPGEAARMLRDARPRLQPLAALAASPLLPAPLRASLRAALAEVIEGARSALEDAWRRQVEEARAQQHEQGRHEQEHRTAAVLPGRSVPGPRTAPEAARAGLRARAGVPG